MSLLLWLVGCAPVADSGSPAAAPEGALLTAEGWSLADPADDPWAAGAPPDPRCPSTAYGPEGAYFEVETDSCSWGTWTQPLGAAVAAGDDLGFTFFHLELWAPEPAEAVVALHIRGARVWELVQPVPAAAAVFEVDVASPVSAPAGAVAAFHVHNHGSNSYRMGSVERVGPAVR